ncbi:MAG: single-stranded DNA-binding protein [Terriglobales bacterium]
MNNEITIIGRVGQTPKAILFKDTENKVVKFSVGVKEYSSKTEEVTTIWFDVDAWNGLGDNVLQTVTKGREVVMRGRLMLSTYKKELNGMIIDWPKAHIKLSSFHLCGPKPVADEGTQNGDGGEPVEQKKKKLVTVQA